MKSKKLDIEEYKIGSVWFVELPGSIILKIKIASYTGPIDDEGREIVGFHTIDSEDDDDNYYSVSGVTYIYHDKMTYLKRVK